MSNFLWTVLASAFGQALAFILYQGFVRSYLGIKSEEDVQEFFDKAVVWFRKYIKKSDKPLEVTVFNNGKKASSAEIKRLQEEIIKNMEAFYELEKQAEESK